MAQKRVKNPTAKKQKAETSQPVLLLSGGSSGIGLATAELFFSKGYRVYELSRKGRSKPGITHLTVDVCKQDEVEKATAEVLSETGGRLDLLICNAGYGIAGAIEETSECDYMRQYDVNYFGTLRLIRAVLPAMREQGRGRIICLSSVAGILPIPFQSFYSGTKAALLSLIRCLAMETRPFGIEVTALCPGDVSTGFTAAREKTAERAGGPYENVMKRSLARMEKDEKNGRSSQYIAEQLWDLSRRHRPKAVYVAGASYKLIAFLEKCLPLRLTDFLLSQMYA